MMGSTERIPYFDFLLCTAFALSMKLHPDFSPLLPVWGHEWVAAPFIWVINLITSHIERMYAGLLNYDMQSKGSRAVQEGVLHSDSSLHLLDIILQLASSMCIYHETTLFSNLAECSVFQAFSPRIAEFPLLNIYGNRPSEDFNVLVSLVPA